MTKALIASAVVLLASAVTIPSASAAPAAHVPHRYVASYADLNRLAFPSRVAYGTRYHGAGTITGGPAGGLPSRN